MPRQRLRLPNGLSTTIGQKLTGLIGLALIYGGGVIVALAAGATRHDVQTYTRYQTVYHQLAGIDPARWSTPASVVIVVLGILLFGGLLRLGWAQRLVPHRARTPLVLDDGPRGRTVVNPRAIERAVEASAYRTPGVRAVRARLGGGELAVALHARTAEHIPRALHATQDAAIDALERSGIPSQPVRVTVTRFTPPTTQEQLR